MNQNMYKIRAGLLAMAGATPQILGGTVISGSVSNTSNTCDVQLFTGPVIHEVLLSAASDNEHGFISYPKDSSHVIIGSINGAGQWAVLATSEIEKHVVKTGGILLEVSEAGIQLKKESTIVNLSDMVRIATVSESLHAILTDLVNAIAALTVGTSSGPSTVPMNIASYTALLPRINNLLSP